MFSQKVASTTHLVSKGIEIQPENVVTPIICQYLLRGNKPVNLLLLAGWRRIIGIDATGPGVGLGLVNIIVFVGEAPSAGGFGKNQQSNSDDQQDHCEDDTNYHSNHAAFEVAIVMYASNVHTHFSSLLVGRPQTLSDFASDVKRDHPVARVGIDPDPS